tara:strand:- start:261 stop:1022 length:762 start_codon:yes stop_codon:yes gene_type:complete
MNRTKIHWLVGDSLPKHAAMLEAVPGVGNVGKLVVDSLVEKHPSRTLAWILHPDFPPHSTLDGDSLLAPPRICIDSVLLPDGRTIIAVGGNLQPMTAAGQHEVSEAILRLACEADTPQLLVLAGLAAGAEDRQIHVICADTDVRKRLEADDIPVSREHPEAGMIGIAGLLISLSPLHSISTVGLVAETMGASADVVAADRLAGWIEAAFDLPLDLNLDSTEKTAARILDEMNVGGDLEETLAMTEGETGDFYV